MQAFVEYWEDQGRAFQSLALAIDRYVLTNLGKQHTSPPGPFVLDSDEDAVDALIRLYNRLAMASSKASEALLDAARRVFILARNGSPPTYFNAAISGTFLMIAAPDAERPRFAAFLQTFRPLIFSKWQREQDLYYSALLRTSELMPQLSENYRREAGDALRSEWTYLRDMRMPSASLARVLSADSPSDWPTYLEVICRSNWPDNAEEPTSELMFQRSIQNILREVSAPDISAQLWRLATYINQNRSRADATGEALFGHLTDSPGVQKAAPFRITSPNAARPSAILSEYTIAAEAASAPSDWTRLNPGRLEEQDFQMTCSFRQWLVRFALSVGVVFSVPWAA